MRSSFPLSQPHQHFEDERKLAHEDNGYQRGVHISRQDNQWGYVKNILELILRFNFYLKQANKAKNPTQTKVTTYEMQEGRMGRTARDTKEGTGGRETPNHKFNSTNIQLLNKWFDVGMLRDIRQIMDFGPG